MTAEQKDANQIIKQARSCYARVHFGTSEQWVRISKSDARLLVKRSWSDDTGICLAEDGSRDCFLS